MEKKGRTRKSVRPWTTAPAAAAALVFFAAMAAVSVSVAAARAPRRILVDTDMDTDDLFALFYLLKQDRSEFDVKVRTCKIPDRHSEFTCWKWNDLLIILGFPLGENGPSISHACARAPSRMIVCILVSSLIN